MFRHLLCACQGLVSVVVGMMILSARLVVSAFMAQRMKSGHTPATEDHPARQPKLVQSCFLAYMLPVGLARTHRTCASFCLHTLLLHLRVMCSVLA